MGVGNLERILDRVREIASRVATSEGMELVDVEMHGRGPGAILRIYLDKPDGVTLEDCQTVSRQVGILLDINDVMEARYRLEVSSPGLDRRLVKPSDYQRFTGRQLRLLLKTSRDGRRRFQGRLLGMEEGIVKVQLDTGALLTIGHGEIERANLVPEFG